MAVFNSICIITDDYPSKRRPTTFVFIEQLVNAFLDLEKDLKISIIAPQSLTKCMIRRIPILPRKQVYNTETNQYNVYRPYSLSFGNGRPFLYRLFSRFNQRGVDRCLCEIKPSIIYGHFWVSAYKGYGYARKKAVPIFVATGESVIRFRANTKHKQDFCDYVNGVVCVSSKNQQESIELGLTTKTKCIVIPNAVNPKLFHRMNKMECRRQLGFPLDIFIVIYVGWFNERKGISRLIQALKTIDGKPVYSIFIGGNTILDIPNVLFSGRVVHDKLPIYLNAADVFVLPTLHEGCCNAIIEALACGLPIISSNLPFNKDILNEKNSILVDPANTQQLASAIKELRDQEEIRLKMSADILNNEHLLAISHRARLILQFMETHV